MVKLSLKKQPTSGQSQYRRLTPPEISIPPHHCASSGKSKGFWRLNWLHLTGQSIDWMERIKTCKRSVGGRTYGRPDERINPSDTGRMTRNWVKVFRIYKT
jgi:hypothetical protein